MIPFDPGVRRALGAEFIDEVLVGALGATHIAVGENFRFGHKARGDADLLLADDRFQTRVVQLLEIDGEVVSSSHIRGLVLGGAIEYAGQAARRSVHARGRRRGARRRARPRARLSDGEPRARPALRDAGARACTPLARERTRATSCPRRSASACRSRRSSRAAASSSRPTCWTSPPTSTTATWRSPSSSACGARSALTPSTRLIAQMALDVEDARTIYGRGET